MKLVYISNLVIAELLDGYLLLIGNILERLVLLSEPFKHHLLLVYQRLEFLLLLPAVVLLSLDLVP
jgi:hypothetical protein